MSSQSTYSEPLEGRYVFAVAQLPFENESQSTSVVNVFGTLVPVLDPTGRYIRAEDLRTEFLNRSLVWWMLRPGARNFAEPGRLVSAHLERALRFDQNDPDKDLYQVIVDTVEVVSPRSVIEILTVSDDRVQRVPDLVNVPDIIAHDHPPTELVLIRWHRRLYGPFRASSVRRGDGRWNVTLTTSSTDSTAFSMVDEALLRIGDEYQSYRDVEVSIERQPPNRSTNKRTCTYELLTGAGLDALRRLPHEIVSVARDIDVIKRFAAKLFGRRDRQQLSALLERLSPEPATEGADLHEVQRVLESARSYLATDESLVRQLAEALVESGIIEDAVSREIDARVEKYVVENAARLQSDISSQLRDGEQAVRKLRDERDQLEDHLRRRSREAEDLLKQELAVQTAAHEQQLLAARADIDKERATLEQERDLVVRHLEAVTARFEGARSEVLRDFSAIWPLFMRLSDTVQGSARLTGPENAGTRTASEIEPALQDRRTSDRLAGSVQTPAFPSFVYRPDGANRPELAEEAFLDRLRAHVRARGFTFAPLDLVTFHLSVKCGDLTILGGVSGTGKSTLPRLYAEALMGEEQDAVDEANGRYLHVAVRPSWLDQDDLLGHVNSLDGRYVPSESGLYPLLVRAQEEYESRGPSSGTYLACLDEMNLAHVEHYLAGVLQALERGEGLRRVSIFDTSSVNPSDPYAGWASLNLPPSIRFVGTVNYDETTRPLSRRLLDRANVVELREAGAFDFGPPRSDRDRPAVSGPAVATRDVRAWVNDRTLDSRYAEVLDGMRASLLALQCPVTPRRFRAISRFVASANGLCEPDVAFDLQVCQRVLPQVRGIYGPVERDALEQLSKAISTRGFLPESERILASIMLREVGVPT